MQQFISIHINDEGKFSLCEPQELSKLNPKELLLYSAALCAGMTLKSILDKEKVAPLKIEIKRKSGHMIPPALFFFLKTLDIWDLLWFHTNFKILCSSVKNAIGILIGIALNQ